MKKFTGTPLFRKALIRFAVLLLPLMLAISCAPVDAPDGRSPKIPTVTPPLDRYEGLNEKRDPVTRVKLGRDILVPQPLKEDVMPDVAVGPYELRGETLASALQLILDDYDVSLAFESNEGLTRRITVANLHGKLKDVVNRVCSLADLYCHFESDTLTIKNTETFIVDLPPVGGGGSSSSGGDSSSSSSSGSSSSSSSSSDSSSSSGGSSTASAAYSQIAAGLKAVIGTSPTVDESTRVMIYTATQRSHKYALQYFERLRKNTALIIFETNIWEVTLNNENRTGINWTSLMDHVGNLSFDAVLPGGAGGVASGIGAPIKITPAYANGSGSVTSTAVLEFLSSRGAVKTISQPQITVLSGSKASFAVEQKQNFVKKTTTTPCSPTPCTPTTSTDTDTVTTGLTMSVTSAWDQSTVYGDLNITLNDLLKLQDFGSIQLPLTTTRSLQTQIRVRPGDAVLIGGLVSEKDNLSDSGPGFMTPLFTTNKVAAKVNTELVFLLRPRVIAFDMGSDSDTVPVVDAPKEGFASKTVPVKSLNRDVKDIFKKPPTAPVPDISNEVKSLFGVPAAAAAAPAAAPPAVPATAPVPLAGTAGQGDKAAVKKKEGLNQ